MALINELTYLLRQYVVNSEDAEAYPEEHFALINLLSSLEFLQRYANKEPKALALMKELHKNRRISYMKLSNIKKHIKNLMPIFIIFYVGFITGAYSFACSLNT